MNNLKKLITGMLVLSMFISPSIESTKADNYVNEYNLTATPICDAILLEWNDVHPGEWYMPKMITEYGIYPLEDFAIEETSYLHEDREEGVEYCYVVQAVDVNGVDIGIQSQQACAITEREGKCCEDIGNLYSGSHMEMLNEQGGWSPVNVVDWEEADENNSWNVDRFNDDPLHDDCGADWIYGSGDWDNPSSVKNVMQTYRLRFTIPNDMCTKITIDTCIDDEAIFYLQKYNGPITEVWSKDAAGTYELSLFYDGFNCLSSGEYTLYIEHWDRKAQNYGIIFASTCETCCCPNASDPIDPNYINPSDHDPGSPDDAYDLTEPINCGDITILEGDCILYLSYQIGNVNGKKQYSGEAGYQHILEMGGFVETNGNIIGNITYNTDPKIIQGRTMLPARDITDWVPGAWIHWKAPTKEVIVGVPADVPCEEDADDYTGPWRVAHMTVGDPMAQMGILPSYPGGPQALNNYCNQYQDNETILNNCTSIIERPIDPTNSTNVMPVIQNGRTHIALRFATEATTGTTSNVYWMPNHKIASIWFDLKGKCCCEWTEVGQITNIETTNISIGMKNGEKKKSTKQVAGYRVEFTTCDGQTKMYTATNDFMDESGMLTFTQAPIPACARLCIGRDPVNPDAIGNVITKWIYCDGTCCDIGNNGNGTGSNTGGSCCVHSGSAMDMIFEGSFDAIEDASWRPINVLSSVQVDDVGYTAWAERCCDECDCPWDFLYDECRASWVYGNYPWDVSSNSAFGSSVTTQYYRLNFTLDDCYRLNFYAFIDDKATFYLGSVDSDPIYSTASNTDFPLHKPCEPIKFDTDCLVPGGYTLYIKHEDTQGVHYGLIFGAECIPCDCPCEDAVNCPVSGADGMLMLSENEEWVGINNINPSSVELEDWGERCCDNNNGCPWDYMYGAGASWVYGNLVWNSNSDATEWYKQNVYLDESRRIKFEAFVDDEAEFYIVPEDISFNTTNPETTPFFSTYPDSGPAFPLNVPCQPTTFETECLDPGCYTIYIKHENTNGVQYGLIYTAECVECCEQSKCKWFCGCMKNYYDFYPGCDLNDENSLIHFEGIKDVYNDSGSMTIEDWIEEGMYDPDLGVCIEVCLDADGQLVTWRHLTDVEPPTCCGDIPSCCKDLSIETGYFRVNGESVDNLFSYDGQSPEKCTEPGAQIEFGRMLIKNNCDYPICVVIESGIDDFVLKGNPGAPSTPHISQPITIMPETVSGTDRVYLYGSFTMPDCVDGEMIEVFTIKQVDCQTGDPIADCPLKLFKVKCCQKSCCDFSYDWISNISSIAGCPGDEILLSYKIENDCPDDRLYFAIGTPTDGHCISASPNGFELTSASGATLDIKCQIPYDCKPSEIVSCYFIIKCLDKDKNLCDEQKIMWRIKCEDCNCCDVYVYPNQRSIPSVCYGDKGTYRMKVVNNCKDQHKGIQMVFGKTFTSNITNVNPSNMTLAPGEEKNFTVEFEMPECKPDSSVTLSFDMHIDDCESQNVSFKATCKDCTCCDVSFVTSAKRVMMPELCPGDSEKYGMTLKNNCEKQPKDLRVTWSRGSGISAITPSSFTLDPGETQSLSVAFTMPTGCRPGSTQSFNYTVSINECVDIKGSFNAKCRDCNCCDIAVNSTQRGVPEVCPGEKGTYEMSVTNKCDNKDKKITIRYSSDINEIKPISYKLLSGTSKKIEISFTMPKDCKEGSLKTYGFSVVPDDCNIIKASFKAKCKKCKDKPPVRPEPAPGLMSFFPLTCIYSSVQYAPICGAVAF